MPSVGDNPLQTPFARAELHLPDELTVADRAIVTATVVITGGSAYRRGTVLGRIWGTDKYRPASMNNTDGSASPSAVLADYVDATNGDVQGGVYLEGVFEPDKLIFVDSTIPVSFAASMLRRYRIFVKGLTA